MGAMSESCNESHSHCSQSGTAGQHDECCQTKGKLQPAIAADTMLSMPALEITRAPTPMHQTQICIQHAFSQQHRPRQACRR